jgi:hypothetical protein
LANTVHGEDVTITVYPGARRNAAPALNVFTAADLKHQTFKPIQWVIENLVPDGLTILAAKPKLGKSWLMLATAVAVAQGGEVLDSAAAQGDVLYCALEDSARRLQDRLKKTVPSGNWPANLEFWTKLEPLESGGLEQLRSWVDRTARPRLIVIDTFAKVRSPKGKEETNYAADYRAAGALKAFADETGVAVIVVHHTRKMEAEDPMDAVSGTNGLTGAADTILVMKRGQDGVTLYGRGRDIEEIELAVEFDKEACQWRVLGEAAEVRRTQERSAIISALRHADGPMTPAQLVLVTGKSRVSIQQLLGKMTVKGEIKRLGRGEYRLP